MGVPTPQFSTSTDGRVMLWHGHEPATFVDAATARDAIGAASEENSLRKNYIINGDLRISQQNGTTAGTASGYYPVDMFLMSFSNSGTQTVQQVASVTPGGSTHRLRVTATVADAAVAAGDLCTIETRLEGLRVADLLLGSASAKTITLRFGVKAPAGIYCVSLRNGAFNRNYVAEYVIAPGEANTDVVKTATIALDQTGTWATDATSGLIVNWTLMAGTTFQATAGTWAAGNLLATADQYNFMGTVNNVFELFDVSLTVGSTAPEYQVADYAEALRACLRYYWLPTSGFSQLLWMGQAYTTSAAFIQVQYPVTMRATPTLEISAAADFGLTSASGANVISSAVTLGTSSSKMARLDVSGPASLAAGIATVLICQSANSKLAFNARL